MDETTAELISEQMRHANALLQADLEGLRGELVHFRELTGLRLTELESARVDHENRLRSAADGITQFKVYSGLLNGASSLLALLALLKAYILGN